MREGDLSQTVTRIALPALLIAILASGCLDTHTSGPAADNTTIPSSTTPTTTSTPPTPTGPPTGGMLIRPAHAHNESDGFFLEGDESASGFILPGNVTFTFHAANRGADAQAIWDPCGDGNPRITIRDENGTTLDLTGPHVRCMIAVSWRPFASGAELWANLTWNGTEYHDGAAGKAPPGQYDAVATFHAKRGDAETEVTVVVPVNVLDASMRGAL